MKWARTELEIILALQGDTKKTTLHLLDEVSGGERKFEEEGWFWRDTVNLDAEPDVGRASAAKEGADHHRFGSAWLGELVGDHADVVVAVAVGR